MTQLCDSITGLRGNTTRITNLVAGVTGCLAGCLNITDQSGCSMLTSQGCLTSDTGLYTANPLAIVVGQLRAGVSDSVSDSAAGITSSSLCAVCSTGSIIIALVLGIYMVHRIFVGVLIGIATVRTSVGCIALCSTGRISHHSLIAMGASIFVTANGTSLLAAYHRTIGMGNAQVRIHHSTGVCFRTGLTLGSFCAVYLTGCIVIAGVGNEAMLACCRNHYIFLYAAAFADMIAGAGLYTGGLCYGHCFAPCVHITCRDMDLGANSTRNAFLIGMATICTQTIFISIGLPNGICTIAICLCAGAIRCDIGRIHCKFTIVNCNVVTSKQGHICICICCRSQNLAAIDVHGAIITINTVRTARCFAARNSAAIHIEDSLASNINVAAGPVVAVANSNTILDSAT